MSTCEGTEARHTAVSLRALLERAAEQAARLSAIVGRALESEAIDAGVLGRERDPPRLPNLTPREEEVLRLILKGNSSKEIARELGISRATARCHSQNILTKLGVESRGQAAALAATRPARIAVVPGIAELTPREREVLRALSAGLGRREIAEQLVVSPETVRTHIQRVLAKLGVHSVIGAMAVARAAGLVPLRAQSTVPPPGIGRGHRGGSIGLAASDA